MQIGHLRNAGYTNAEQGIETKEGKQLTEFTSWSQTAPWQPELRARVLPKDEAAEVH